MTPVNTDGRHYQLKLDKLKSTLVRHYGRHFANLFGIGIIAVSFVFLALNDVLKLSAFNYVNLVVMVAAFIVTFDPKIKKVGAIISEINKLEARLKRETLNKEVVK